MRIKKIDMNGYKATLYKTNKYTTIHLNFLFEQEYTKKNIYTCDLLAEYMIRTNKKYKTRKELYDKILYNYSMGYKFHNYQVGKKSFTEIEFNFCDPILVKDDNYIHDAIKFAGELIFLPNFENGKLDKDELDIVKNMMIDSKADALEDPKYKANQGFYDAILPNTYVTEDYVHSRNEMSELMNSITEEDLINMYHTIFDESFVGLSILGNVNDKILSTIKDTFVFKNLKKLDTKYNAKLKINTSKKEIIVKDINTSESILFVAYSCKKNTSKLRPAFFVINMMLNYDAGRILHKVLRDEEEIVYNSSSYYNSRGGFFVINALIDKKNYEKAVKAIDKVMDKLNDEKIISECLDLAKKEINKRDYISDENKYNVIADIKASNYKWSKSRKQANKLINKLTVKDCLGAVSMLEKKVIYLYEGDKNE